MLAIIYILSSCCSYDAFNILLNIKIVLSNYSKIPLWKDTRSQKSPYIQYSCAPWYDDSYPKTKIIGI